MQAGLPMIRRIVSLLVCSSIFAPPTYAFDAFAGDWGWGWGLGSGPAYGGIAGAEL